MPPLAAVKATPDRMMCNHAPVTRVAGVKIATPSPASSRQNGAVEAATATTRKRPPTPTTPAIAIGGWAAGDAGRQRRWSGSVWRLIAAADQQAGADHQRLSTNGNVSNKPCRQRREIGRGVMEGGEGTYMPDCQSHPRTRTADAAVAANDTAYADADITVTTTATRSPVLSLPPYTAGGPRSPPSSKATAAIMAGRGGDWPPFPPTERVLRRKSRMDKSSQIVMATYSSTTHGPCALEKPCLKQRTLKVSVVTKANLDKSF